jgi:hypothetical protein
MQLRNCLVLCALLVGSNVYAAQNTAQTANEAANGSNQSPEGSAHKVASIGSRTLGRSSVVACTRTFATCESQRSTSRLA